MPVTALEDKIILNRIAVGRESEKCFSFTVCSYPLSSAFVIKFPSLNPISSRNDQLKVVSLRDLSFVHSIPEHKSIHRFLRNQILDCLACGISRACETRGNQHKALTRVIPLAKKA